MKDRKTLFIGIIITIVYFAIHLAIIDDYGISWDFHYHYYAGLYHLGLPVPSINDPPPVPFTPPDPRLTVVDPFGPFTQIIPTLSHLFLYKKWRLFPFDSAYNFPMVIFGSLGVGLLFLFLFMTNGLTEALFGSMFLGLLPTYFGYLHNNMKDIPNAFAFTLSIFLFWRLVKTKKLKALFVAAVAFAFAFNVKINSVLIPVICFAWFTFISYKDLLKTLNGKLQIIYKKKIHLVILYFLLAPLAAVFLWWPFWQDPIAKLLELPYFYLHNTLGIPVLFFGKIYQSGVNIPWCYPYVYIGVTTPLPILFSFIIGFFLCFKKAVKKEETCLLFILWFFIPLLRYFSPKSGAIDGVRHFMEVIYPLSAIAGIGAAEFYHWLIKITKKKLSGVLFFACLLIFLSKNIVGFHPYQTSFFNLLIGGINGASGKFDIDFWGTPQKEAVSWLNKNAPYDSTVHVVMAQSSAGLYLRGDLLKSLNSKNFWKSDYTVVLNRQSFFSIYNVAEYIKQRIAEDKIVFQKTINSVPLVWIFKN